MNQYIQTYKQIIFQANINKAFKYNFSELKNAFINDAIEFPAELPSQNNLLLEKNYLFTLSDNFINNIFMCKNGTLFSKDILLTEFPQNSREYNKIVKSKSQYPFFVYQVKFTVAGISKVIKDFLQTNNKNQIKQLATEFLNQHTGLAGAMIPLQNHVSILLFDIDKESKEMIIHEFYHYFQQITSSGYDNKIESEAENLLLKQNTKNILQKHGISEDLFLYLFSKKEFLPHVNDLCHNLKLVYTEFYKNDKITPQQFLKLFFENWIQMKNISTVQTLLNQYSIISSDECSTLSMIKIAYDLNFKYEFIVQKLTQIFN